jgi:lipopolysaccharide/colanic/teichoic acid biosynthesis glycosyltransferase
LAELCEDLVREYGWEVTVVAGPTSVEERNSKARWLYEKQFHNGVDIYRTAGTTFGKGRFVGRFANYLSFFASACIAGLRVPRQDIIVALTDPPIVGLPALLTARRCRAKFVFLCQDIFPEVANLLEDFRSPAVNWILQQVNRLLVRKANRVIALGETMRQRLIEGKGADADEVTVIHNWADCQRIEPGPKENPFSLENGLTGRFVVMHSGNIGLSQNLEALVEAAGYLRSQSDIVVAIVGNGVKRPALEDKVRSMGLDNIRFFPYQPKDRLMDSFGTADVFVVSLKKGLAGVIVPSKLYGILAAGKPYVAAVEDESEVSAITKEYDCGLLAAPGDPKDLADKILTLHDDRDEARRLGHNARRAGLRFDRKNQVALYNEVFRWVVHSERATPLLKRAFDVILSGTGLIFSSPLWLAIAASIKMEDGGPVFYWQERVGRGGRSFRGFKFRSMVPDADKKYGLVQAKEDDPRITRVGRLLRATAMDELPQLWNIFKGDMSFVGPRALAVQEVEVNGNGESVSLEDIPGYEERHSIRPGLTGITQIFADRDVPRRKKFRYDRLYARRQSFGLDMKLIALSFWITFRGKWEVRGRKL